jgi:hypothetical protein
MSEERLDKLTLTAGRYEGELTAAPGTVIEAVHRDRVVATADAVPDAGGDGRLRVCIDIPPEVLSDGVQVVSLRSTVTGRVLDRVTFLAGEALDEDLRAEVALLREELELLKRAFRRHAGMEADR